jgi:hypothetical protein
MTMIKSVKGNPNPLATFEEKKSDEYGLKIAQLISSEWFNGSFATSKNCNFLTRRDYVRNKRLFVRGEQSIDGYKTHQARGDNDLSFLNLDWTNINLVEKFCRIVSNGISDENYRLDIRATDRITLKLKEDKKDQYRKDLASMPMLKKAKEALGIDLMPQGFVPEDEEEMRLFLEIKDRPKVEIAEEILIQYIKSSNNWDFIEKQNNKNLVDLGLAGIRIFTDKNDGVKLDYVDPEHYVHSYVKRNDFSDKYYEGVVDTITLSDLKRESDFTDVQLRQIAKTYSTTNNLSLDYNNCPIESIIDIKVDVLRFAWKTSKTTVFKQKLRKGEVVKVSKKNELFEAPDRADVGVLSKTLDTWFEGNFVVGTNAIYGYQECENLARDIMNKAMSPFVFMATDIYENKPQSFLTKIEPIANQMQNIALKLQSFLAELKGDITEIDLDLLAELDDGKGGGKKEVWQTALKLLQVKGIVFKKRVDMGEMGVKEASAVKTYPSGTGGHISSLLNAWAFKYNLIRDITGVNPAADGSLSQDALLGVSQMAKLATNTATKHIVDTAVMINKKTCETISTRIHSIYKLKEAKHIQEIYNNVVGKHLLDALDVLKDRHLHEFGFTFEMKPTTQELQEFNADLQMALQEGNINPEVKIEASRIAKVNIKLATEYLMYHRRKRIKQMQEEQMALAQNKSQNDAMAAQAKTQAESQKYQEKLQADLAFKQQLVQIELQKEAALLELKKPYEEEKFNRELYLEQVRGAGKVDMETFKENRKDERTKLQASQQSKILEQRNKDGEPIDFKNENNFQDLLNT